MRHQFQDAGRLGKARMLDLADAFSRQYFDRRIRQIGPDQGHRLVNRLLRVRRQPVVKRQRITLVFQQDAGAELGDGGKPALQFPVHRRSMGGNGFAILRDSHFRTVASDGRKLFGGKNQIDIVERTAAD